jgi:hypothetical protein
MFDERYKTSTPLRTGRPLHEKLRLESQFLEVNVERKTTKTRRRDDKTNRRVEGTEHVRASSRDGQDNDNTDDDTETTSKVEMQFPGIVEMISLRGRNEIA